MEPATPLDFFPGRYLVPPLIFRWSGPGRPRRLDWGYASLRLSPLVGLAPARTPFFIQWQPLAGEEPFASLKMVGTTGLAMLRSACLRSRARYGSNSVLHPVAASGWGIAFSRFRGIQMVGTTGFEPATPTTPLWCATRLRHVPFNHRQRACVAGGKVNELRLKSSAYFRPVLRQKETFKQEI